MMPGAGPSGTGPPQAKAGSTYRFYLHRRSGSPVTIVPVVDAPDSQTAPRRRPKVLLVILAALVVLTAVTWAAGGLKAQPGGPVAAKVGSVVGQGLFNVQIMDAHAGRMKINSSDPLANLLVVRMRVTNLGDQSFGISSFLEGVAAEPQHGKYLTADFMRSQGYAANQVTSSIHPRLPVTVQLVWPLGNATAPRTATLALRMWEYGQSFTTDTFYWSVTKQSPIAAEVAVPVRTGATS
jgi:hypothetical protein